MGIGKPTGQYAEQMIDPDGWPEVDEDAFYDRAQEYTRVLRQLTEVLEACQHHRSEIFEGGVWSGGAAIAAQGVIDDIIGELAALQNGLVTVITWQRHIAMSIVQTKSDIGDNVEMAQKQINALENDPGLEAAERITAINTVLGETYEANVSAMAGAAQQILASKAWKPPQNALTELLDQKAPPPVTLPDTPAPAPSVPAAEERPRPGPPQPAPMIPPTVAPAVPAPPSPGPSTPRVVPPLTPGMPANSGQPATGPVGPGLAVPAGPAGAPSAPLGPPAPLSPAASASPLGAGGRGKGVTPASVSAPAPPRAEESAAAGAPAVATGMPGAAMAPGGSGSGRAGAGPGASSGAPLGQKPSDAKTRSPRTRPASFNDRNVVRGEPVSLPTSIDRRESHDTVTVPPIIPVSAARAERDAIVEAATADASRRAGRDPLQIARRIAAALNAPGSPGERDIGFFWVTAVTTDGAIVVANSYGLAYIPDGLRLPEMVQMATADETIPAAERASWATYPVIAVQGWAAHRNTELRAVIGTAQQLAESDSGAVKIVLEPDDIPDTGVMDGRSRLDVVAPEVAERLAETSDLRLIDLLPPAPVDVRLSADEQHPPEAMDPDSAAQLAAAVAAGNTDLPELLGQLPGPAVADRPPVDQRPMLWFELMKPMSSRASGRRVAHLRAFHSYAAHAQEISLRQAHTAAEPEAQRSAVADWLYWHHLTELHEAALAAVAGG